MALTAKNVEDHWPKIPQYSYPTGLSAYVIFQVLAAVLPKIQVFGDVTRCLVVVTYPTSPDVG
jgi:hypothetical protein